MFNFLSNINIINGLEISILFSPWMLTFYHLSLLVYSQIEIRSVQLTWNMKKKKSFSLILLLINLRPCFYLFWICLCLLLKMLGSCCWSSGGSLVLANKLLDQCHCISYVEAVHVYLNRFFRTKLHFLFNFNSFKNATTL